MLTRSGSYLIAALIGSALGCTGRSLDGQVSTSAHPIDRGLPHAAPPPVQAKVRQPLLEPKPQSPQSTLAEATNPPLSAESDAQQACPTGMVHIHFDHCPKLERRCLDNRPSLL